MLSMKLPVNSGWPMHVPVDIRNVCTHPANSYCIACSPRTTREWIDPVWNEHRLQYVIHFSEENEDGNKRFEQWASFKCMLKSE